MKKILYNGKHLRLVEKGIWQYVERTTGEDVTYIIPITKDREFIFIKEYRIPFEKYVIGFPAGLVGDLGIESLNTAALRELEEETGFTGRLVNLTAGPISSGLTTETIHFFMAQDCYKIGNGGGVNGEDISVLKIPAKDVKNTLNKIKEKRVDLIDPKIYLGLYFYNSLYSV